jgi:hypothetical protein
MCRNATPEVWLGSLSNDENSKRTSTNELGTSGTAGHLRRMREAQGVVLDGLRRGVLGSAITKQACNSWG